MNRSGAYVLLGLAILIVGFGAYYLGKRAPAAATKPVEIAATVTEKTVTEDTAAYTIDATYPQLGLTIIDSQIERMVQVALNEFRGYPANPADSALSKNEFTGRYNVVHTEGSVVSVELRFSEYTGGAHPNTAIVGANFYKTSGKELILDDALALIGMTLEEVAATADTQLNAALGEAFFSEGAEPKVENYAIFKVSRDKVIFIFNNYQVGPYAAGPQEVSFARVK